MYECQIAGGIDQAPSWARKKLNQEHGLVIDQAEKNGWLGKSFNDLFGLELYAQMGSARHPW